MIAQISNIRIKTLQSFCVLKNHITIVASKAILQSFHPGITLIGRVYQKIKGQLTFLFFYFVYRKTQKEILMKLDHLKLLSNQNREIVLTHTRPYELKQSLTMLEHHCIFNKENVAVILKQKKHPILIAESLLILNQAAILNNENRGIIIADPQPDQLCLALKELHKNHILSEANIEVLFLDENPVLCAQALVCLQELNILNDATRSSFLSGLRSYQHSDAICVLKGKKKLSSENVIAVLNDPHPKTRAESF